MYTQQQKDSQNRSFGMKEPTTNLNISLFFADHLTRMEERDNRAVINKYWDKVYW